MKVGSDTYSLRDDRIGDECRDFYDNCFYKKDGGQLNYNHSVLKIKTLSYTMLFFLCPYFFIQSVYSSADSKTDTFIENSLTGKGKRALGLNKNHSGDPSTAEGSKQGYCFRWTKDCDACKSGPSEENCLIYW